MQVELLKSTRYGEAGRVIDTQPNIADVLMSRGIARRTVETPPVPPARSAAPDREPKRKAAKAR